MIEFIKENHNKRPDGTLSAVLVCGYSDRISVVFIYIPISRLTQERASGQHFGHGGGISELRCSFENSFADVFYSDDPVSDTDQPEYVDQSAVGYYGRLVDLAHGGRRHGHTDDGML